MTRPAVVLTLTLPGPPRTKKTSNRLVKAGARHRVLPSKAWETWRDACYAHTLQRLVRSRRIESQHAIAYPVNVAAVFYRDAARGDAVGYYQGLADVLEYCGIVDDDKWIVAWDGSRLLVDRTNPRVEVEVRRV